MRWNGFQNKSTFILYQMLFGQGNDGNLDRLLSCINDEELNIELRNIYYGAINSNIPNALKARREFIVEEPINYKEIIKRIKRKFPHNFIQNE